VAISSFCFPGESNRGKHLGFWMALQ